MNRKIMTATAEKFYRDQILKGLKQLTHEHCEVFKRMYSPQDLEAPIENVVEEMPTERLFWALQQVENTLKKGGVYGTA